MWMSARNLLYLPANISALILWVPTAASAILGTSCLDIAALVSKLIIQCSKAKLSLKVSNQIL